MSEKLSFSAITLYNRCPCAFDYRYHQCVVKANDSQRESALKLGSIVHQGLANHWLHQNLYKDIVIDDSMECQKALAIIDVYHDHYGEEYYQTEAIEAGFETDHFIGQVDGIIIDPKSGERILLEHKTAAGVSLGGTTMDYDAPYWVKLNIDLQIRLYCAACHLNRVLYDVIKKPAIRLKSKETNAEFIVRYKQALIDDPQTFQRRELILTDDDIQEAIEDANEIYQAVNDPMNRYRKNRNACCGEYGCDYLHICAHCDKDGEYTFKPANCELSNKEGE